ncbi:amino-acid N-acetyltransferase [Treponema pectinovorum]|uniref:amino-acid N-acetyltransferase n=1 Tax=Treponema pectinovorum TaxID=164 RepID=UPI003D906567
MTQIEKSIQAKAESIRDVIRYIKRFNDATVVIYIDDRIIDSSFFSGHIHDISLIKQAGLKVLIVPGAHNRIDKILSQNSIQWQIHNGNRITDQDAMSLIKTAAFEVANNVMTSFAGEHITAVIGNWIRARGKGVIQGIDYGCAGEIDKIDDSSLSTVLKNGFIPIFPCIGWSLSGKPYNISSRQLASQLAMHLKADKLFFLIPDAELTQKYFIVPKDIGLSPEGHIPAMNIEELDEFILKNQNEQKSNSTNQENLEVKKNILSILHLSKIACTEGVSRTHILNGFMEGTLPCEIFSNLGSGTMIYSSNYGKIRPMRREDVSQVLALIRPFVFEGFLLPRTEQQLEAEYNDYIIYEIDGAIRACSALHIYDRAQAEIAAVAVDKNYAHIGIGPKMIEYLIEKAKTINLESVFILTTQTADWFESLGFTPDSIETLPQKRKELWNKARASKLFRLKLK